MNRLLTHIRTWLSGGRGDFLLFAVALLLVNLVAGRAFFRIDLTADSVHSLSRGSRDIVRTLEEPVTVQVFFSSNLPSPYNGVERYLRDILPEYRRAGRGKFNFEFFDMDNPEHQGLAGNHSLNMIRVQEIKDNQVALRNAWMGLAIQYSDTVEILDGLTSSAGLEYRITNTIARMAADHDILTGLSEPVRMTLYITPELAAFGIQGFDQIENAVKTEWQELNRRSFGKIDYNKIEVNPAGAEDISIRYGLQLISWQSDGRGREAGNGVIGIILEHGTRRTMVPISIARTFFGGFSVAGLDTLQDTVQAALQALVSRSTAIGYLSGYGEPDINDRQNGAAAFAALLSDRYELVPVDLAHSSIPPGISLLILNGPRTEIPEAHLYQIDQFLLSGGNLMVMHDPFNEQIPPGANPSMGGQPEYSAVTSGMERLFAAWGLSVPPAYVLDKASFTLRDRTQGEIPLYYAPIADSHTVNSRHPVSKGLSYLLFVQTAPVMIEDAQDHPDRKATVLVKSSAESWRMKDHIDLTPFALRVPDSSVMAQENLAVLLEGRFQSAFSADSSNRNDSSSDSIGARSHLDHSVQKGSVLVMGTSIITTASILGDNSQQPVGTFLRNAVDYLNGQEELIAMRAKGQALQTLKPLDSTVQTLVQAVNTWILPALAAFAGLAVWRHRVVRRRRIQHRYEEKA